MTEAQGADRMGRGGCSLMSRPGPAHSKRPAQVLLTVPGGMSPTTRPAPARPPQVSRQRSCHILLASPSGCTSVAICMLVSTSLVGF